MGCFLWVAGVSQVEQLTEAPAHGPSILHMWAEFIQVSKSDHRDSH